MSTPDDLKFAESHEWVRTESDGTLTVGISDHAQEALGDIVFIDLPEAGRQIAAGDTVAVVESVKAASDIYAPVAGEIVASNADLANSPDAVNGKPYEAWLFKIKPSDPAATDKLLSAEQYRQSIGE
ncbi:glycine cleavage system protein GcvH [Robbsia sp. Bb-Pol-6]|uniref:Glycine cleavage system H protein n=1 Tax=Robbsia betulipollinis TaxID=2981849 RepID=A0ABT3ZSE3_9BURK|nr:glycine cleavage system protein GcvH [Robbsia betulipollinis]MCY0389145.1 glycine cleavage system protein GcvH [Robbsia betulipollinis]